MSVAFCAVQIIDERAMVTTNGSIFPIENLTVFLSYGFADVKSRHRLEILDRGLSPRIGIASITEEDRAEKITKVTQASPTSDTDY